MKITMFTTGALTLSLLASNVMAAVSETEAARLGNELTPIGADGYYIPIKPVPAAKA